MPVQYDVRLADPFGNYVAQLNSFLSLEFARRVNEVGYINIKFPLNTAPYVARDYMIEIWRKVDNGPFYLDGDTAWLLRADNTSINPNEYSITYRGYDAIQLVARRIVAYASGSSQADKAAAPADNQIKAVARENFGTLATDTARSWANYINIQADVGQGASVDKAFTRQNVLTVMQAFASSSAQSGNPVFFDMVRLPTSYLPLFDFRTYINQRGTDRTLNGGIAPVVFDPAQGNITDITIENDYRQEITYVYAEGQGRGADRNVQTASDSTRIALSPFGRIEASRDSRQTAATTTLQAEANAALFDGRPRRGFNAKVVQTTGTKYGRDYYFGDKVTANVSNLSFACWVSAVAITYSNKEEKIDIALQAVDVI